MQILMQYFGVRLTRRRLPSLSQLHSQAGRGINKLVHCGKIALGEEMGIGAADIPVRSLAFLFAYPMSFPALIKIPLGSGFQQEILCTPEEPFLTRRAGSGVHPD